MMTLSSTSGAGTSHGASPLPAYFTCLREHRLTIVSAHRGGPQHGHAENTLEAFAALSDKGRVLGETDIHTSRDGVLVLNHDDRLDRTTTLSGPVEAYDWREIRAAWMRDPSGAITSYHPPSLPDLLAATREGPVIQLDIKKGVPIDALLTVVEKAGAQHRVIYLAYSDADIATIVRRQPEAMVSTVIPSLADLHRLMALGVRADHLQAMFFERDIDPAYFAALRAQGVSVLVAAITAEAGPDGGPNRPLSAARYAEIAKSGAQILVSNFPDIARAALPGAAPSRCGSSPLAYRSPSL